MLLERIATASAAVAATNGRRQKVAVVAQALADASPPEVPIVVAYLSGELRQRRTGVGWAALRDRPSPAVSPTLSVLAVDAAMQRMADLSGAGSTGRRAALLKELLGAATDAEQRLLLGLLTGELRQGALEGVMVAAVAVAAGVPESAVRRAHTLAGDLGEVAAAALTDGAAGLRAFRLVVGRPLQPMLAQSAESIGDAWARSAAGQERAAVEWKLDGIRVQIHRSGPEVAVFTRTLDDVTARLPEVVEAALALPTPTAVLDGEAIALRPDGRPAPFQVTGSRVGRRVDVAAARERTPLTVFLFDALHVDGVDLVDEPAHVRAAALAAAAPAQLRVPRLVTSDVGSADRFVEAALAQGHEGVVVKSLDARYEAGRRGAGWLKVKPVNTLDLVVLAAEWGHGRRHGWLSNLHLGARDPLGSYGEPGGYVMLGKTFKGLTDAVLAWQTERLQQLAVVRDDWVVQVRPELVVEVAFDGVQTSPRYPAGLALRFARVVRYRSDKSADQADTVEMVRALHPDG